MKRFINDIKKFKAYIIYQTKAELKNEIFGSTLGWLWLFIEPLCYMFIYAFIGAIVFNSSISYYAIFIFSGLLIWNFFSKVINSSVRLVNRNKETISKVYLPKFILLIIVILVNIIKLFITFSLLIVFMIIYQVPVGLNILWIVPILFVLIIFTFGVSSILLHLGVFIGDLPNLTNIILKFTFYLSGIFFDIINSVPAPYNNILYYCNPLAFFIISFRECFINGNGINIGLLLCWLCVSILLCFAGIKTIYKHENSYVKVMK